MGFSNADQGNEPGIQNRGCLARDDLVRLTKFPATLSVANFDYAHTQLCEQGWTDLAGERPAAPRRCLSADPDIRSVENANCTLEYGK